MEDWGPILFLLAPPDHLLRVLTADPDLDAGPPRIPRAELKLRQVPRSQKAPLPNKRLSKTCCHLHHELLEPLFPIAAGKMWGSSLP